jgi:cytidylate kinase
MKLYGIAGTNGAGKDSIGIMLAERHGFLFISMTDMLRDELDRRGLPPAREHMRELSAEWRRQSGLGVLIDKSLEHYQKVADHYKGLVVASLRNPGEADRLHELEGQLVWVDADPRTRYDCLQANAASRGGRRAVDDQKTFEQFLADEAAEMQHSGDEATLSISGVKDKADIFLENDGDDIEAFKDEAEKVLKLA